MRYLKNNVPFYIYTKLEDIYRKEKNGMFQKGTIPFIVFIVLYCLERDNFSYFVEYEEVCINCIYFDFYCL